MDITTKFKEANFKQYFSPSGRITRMTYILRALVINLIWFAVILLAGTIGKTIGTVIMIAFLLVLGWVSLCNHSKRCHDRGNSGVYQLIPFYGLWLLFGDGEVGENRYGADPKNRNIVLQ